jgi:hypothetical protein
MSRYYGRARGMGLATVIQFCKIIEISSIIKTTEDAQETEMTPPINNSESHLLV